MVRPRAVHAKPAWPDKLPRFSVRPVDKPDWTAHSCGISCAHTAIMPTNRTIDASAAASSTKVFNMSASVIPRTYGEHSSSFVLESRQQYWGSMLWLRGWLIARELRYYEPNTTM